PAPLEEDAALAVERLGPDRPAVLLLELTGRLAEKLLRREVIAARRELERQWAVVLVAEVDAGDDALLAFEGDARPELKLAQAGVRLRGWSAEQRHERAQRARKLADWITLCGSRRAPVRLPVDLRRLRDPHVLLGPRAQRRTVGVFVEIGDPRLA